jgi:Cu+-exporting ATPase
VHEILPFAEGSSDELLRIAASAAQANEHPLSRAIVEEAHARGITLDPAQNSQNFPGMGARTALSGGLVFLGSARGIETHALLRLSPEWKEFRDRVSLQPASAVFVAQNGRAKGAILLQDQLRPEAREAVRSLLEHRKLRLLLLTGDRAPVAQALATEAGITDVEAGLLPEQKLERIRALQAQGLRVAMVGDGVNDAPALAQADVGIAMGSGAAVAVETAGLALSGGNLARVEDAFLLSERIFRNIRQNLALAFLYNGLALPLAAFGALTPMWASAAMSLSSVSVIANALRLRLKSRT